MRVHGAVIRWILWTVALLGCPAVYLAAVLHPAWDLTAAAAAVPVVSGSVAVLLVTETRWLRIRPVHARPGITLQHLLWTGIPAAIFMIAIAQSAPVTLRVLDYCGTALLIICAGGLPLRWWLTRKAQQPTDRKVMELAQNVAWMRQDMSKRDRLIAAAFDYAGVKVPGGAAEYMKKRHLRPVRPEISDDDTGPQRAVLGGALPWLVGEHQPRYDLHALPDIQREIQVVNLV